jgi:hypothetical protein
MEELLEKKLELLKQAYDVTKAAVFDGTEGDAERYVELYAKREALFGGITAIDKKLVSVGSAPGKDAGVADKRILAVVSDIMELDKAIEPFAKKALAALKGSIKDIRVGKTLNSGYSVQPELAGLHFDTTN